MHALGDARANASAMADRCAQRVRLSITSQEYSPRSEPDIAPQYRRHRIVSFGVAAEKIFSPFELMSPDWALRALLTRRGCDTILAVRSNFGLKNFVSRKTLEQ
jgi:hypothetical protein